MHRTNSPSDVVSTGRVKIDAGEGVSLDVPVAPAAPPTWATLPGKPATFPSSVGEVAGLAAALTAKADSIHPMLYDSGWRDITSRIPVAVTSGKLWIRRTGWTVWLDFGDILTTSAPANEWQTWAGLIPSGYSVPRNYIYVPLSFTGARDSANTANPNTLYNSAQALGPVRLETNGRAIVYGARTGDGLSPLTVRGLVSWPTLDSIPT